MDWGRLAAGALRGVVGAMSMTGYRTLAAEFGLFYQGTAPERMADEAIPKLLAAVPEPVRRRWSTCSTWAMGRSAAWLIRLFRSAGGGTGRVGRCTAGHFGLAATPDRPAAPAASDRRRRPHKVAMLAADHLLYGLVIGRLGGRPD